MDNSKPKSANTVEPPQGHSGYAVIVNDFVRDVFKYHEAARRNSKGGFVICYADAERFGYFNV